MLFAIALNIFMAGCAYFACVLLDLPNVIASGAALATSFGCGAIQITGSDRTGFHDDRTEGRDIGSLS